METTDQLVMPIVVPIGEGSTHLEVVTATTEAVARAVASLLGGSSLLEGPHPDLKEWLVTGMRKTVRRAKPAAFAKALLPGAEPSRHALALGPEAYVGTLKPYQAFTPFERRGQVSGWDLSGTYEVRPLDDDGQDTILVPATLTTGKAAAAAGHVVTQLVLGSDEAQRAAWRTPIVRVVEEVFPQRCHFVIRDAGHTEVAPGTVTAGFVARA